MVYMSKLYQYNRYLKIKNMLLAGDTTGVISQRVGMDFNYLKNQLIPKILDLSIDEIEALIKIEEAKQIKKLDRKTKEKQPVKERIFYNENRVPIALQGIFKTEQDYMNYLLNQYRQGFNR